jgi:acetylornithine aminotransferase
MYWASASRVFAEPAGMRITRAIRAQAARVMHLVTRNPNRVVGPAARDVLSITGIEDGRCVFLCSGSEAVEVAVQAVPRVTGSAALRDSYT